VTVELSTSLMNFKSSLVIKWGTCHVVSVDKELAASWMLEISGVFKIMKGQVA
jgi:hypothetical protein